MKTILFAVFAALLAAAFSLPAPCADSVLLLTPGAEVSYKAALREALAASGMEVTEADLDSGLEGLLDPEKQALTVIAGAESISAEGAALTDRYLKNGGRLLTLGGPVFDTILYPLEGDWFTRDEYLKMLAASVPASKREVILNTSDPGILKRYKRGTNNPDDKPEYTLGDYGLEGSASQLRGVVPDLISWENMNFPVKPAIKKASALAFSAKGDADTSFLYVEVTDNKWSRWYAGVQLTEEWKQYVLSDADFVWWHDSAASEAAHPDLGDLMQLTVGFAQTGAPIPSGRHTFCISDVELLDTQTADGSLPDIFIDTVYPRDQVFRVKNAGSLKVWGNQIFVKERRYTLPRELFSCSPRRQGTGINKSRRARFIPLIEVLDGTGYHSGYAAWMNVFAPGENGKTGIAGCFSAQTEDFYDENGIAAVAEAAKAMLSPALLAEGGTDEYIYPKKTAKAIEFGGSFYALEECPDEITVKTTLLSGDRPVAVTEQKKPAGTGPGSVSVSEKYVLKGTYPDRAVTELFRGGALADRIEQDRLVFMEPKEKQYRKFITAQDGVFMQDGNIVNFFGVNYMPSSGIAEPDNNLFEHYVSRAAYDPDVIAMDLQRIMDIGMNAVSVFIHAGAMDSNNMLDLVDQCADLGIYVDLSLRSGGDLFYADRAQVKNVIDRLQLRELDNIIAYDTVWEPRIGHYSDNNYIGRKGWDGDWERWITEQYGSIARAETLWGTPVPRDENGSVIGVSDEMLRDYSDKYVKMVSAYRRFIDDHVARLFLDTYSYWREQDPNHLISFRMSMSGSAHDKSGIKPDDFCYDFQSLAPAVSFMAPEGYALQNNDSDSMLQAGFANAYAMFAKPDAPVVWKELGRHMWSGSNFNVKPVFQEEQRDYYAKTLEKMFRAYTSGVYCWFFPGGHRLGENSDYGIIDPDGSDRLCTAVLRKYAPMFINQDFMPALEKVFTIDRDASARGIHGIFEDLLPKLREADENGESYGFKTKAAALPGLIKFADDLTEETLSGVPGPDQPLKYLNAIVKSVKKVRRGARTMLQATVINTGHSDWRANTVKLRLGSAVVPIKEDVFYMREATVELPWTKGVLRAEING
ncbi:MAG: hypothetical protein ILO36_06930, partial [Abditibacteriota bacterium]|nr:hypothetical protein [Abditibacteriota bacterium]